MIHEIDSQRVDRWLWAARFYKQRKLATEAVSGGHVHLCGNRVKPSRQIRSGDVLQISRGQQDMEVTILALNEKRGAAPEAQKLYQESEESLLKRKKAAEQAKLIAQEQPHPQRRPDKKARRQIIRFKQ